MSHISCCSTQSTHARSTRDAVFQTVADKLGIPVGRVREDLPLGNVADDVVVELGKRGLLKKPDTAEKDWEVKHVLHLTQ